MGQGTDGMNESWEPEDVDETAQRRVNTLLPEPQRLRIEADGLFKRAKKAEEKNKAIAAERDQLRAQVARLQVAEANNATLAARCDTLQAQVETASGNARLYADRCTALEAEVARLREQSKAALLNARQSQDGWNEALNERNSLRSTVAGLRRALEGLIAAAECIRHWHDTGKDGEGMIVSNAKVHELWAETAKAHTALTASPDEHERRIKGEALREFAKSRDIEVVGNGDWYAGIAAERTATVDDLRDTADRLEKEATNGR